MRYKDIYIIYKGNFKTENQLINNDKLSKKAVSSQEGKELNDLFKLRFILELPLIIPIIIFTIFRIQSMKEHIVFNIKTISIIVIAFLVNYILKFIHEYIHAILYPIKSTLYKSSIVMNNASRQRNYF